MDAVAVCLTVVQAAADRKDEKRKVYSQPPTPSNGDNGGGDGSSSVTNELAATSAAELSDLADAFYIIGWVQIHAGDHSAGYGMWEKGYQKYDSMLPPTPSPPPPFLGWNSITLMVVAPSPSVYGTSPPLASALLRGCSLALSRSLALSLALSFSFPMHTDVSNADDSSVLASYSSFYTGFRQILGLKRSTIKECVGTLPSTTIAAARLLRVPAPVPFTRRPTFSIPASPPALPPTCRA